jgi:flagellar assembly factor FliW
MKTVLNTTDTHKNIYLHRFNSGEYEMLNGNGTDLDLNKVIEFKQGIPGFEELTKFLIVPLKEYPPFQVFQSLEAPPIAMLVISIEHFESKQNIIIGDNDLEQIGAKHQKDTNTFFVIKMTQGKNQFTANTKAPIVINPHTLIGCQVILEHPELDIEHPLDLA